MISLLIAFLFLGSSYLSWGIALSCWTLGKSHFPTFVGILGLFFLDIHFGGYFFLFVLLLSWMLLIVDKKESSINFYLRFFTVLLFVFVVNKLIYGFFDFPGSGFDILRSFVFLWMYDNR